MKCFKCNSIGDNFKKQKVCKNCANKNKYDCDNFCQASQFYVYICAECQKYRNITTTKYYLSSECKMEE